MQKNKLMPTIILGDIHGSTFWKTAVAEKHIKIPQTSKNLQV
jgi:hypothetical protein